MPGTSPLVLYKSVKGVVLCQTMRYFLLCVIISLVLIAIELGCKIGSKIRRKK